MVNWDASDYAHHSVAQMGWAMELVSKLNLLGSEQVLDIGCGDGKVTVEIAKLVPEGGVIGVDKSEEMLKFAEDKFPITEWPNMRFTLMDASALDFNNEFDAVFSSATLHWIIDHRPVLHGIARSLKPGGRCLLQMGGRGNAAKCFETIFMSRSIHERWGQYIEGMQFPYALYDPEEYIPWVKEAGLDPKRVELLPRDMVQPGIEGLAGWMRTTWLPYTQQIPKEQRNQFIDDAINVYLERFPLDEQGMAHVAMVRLEVEAEK